MKEDAENQKLALTALKRQHYFFGLQEQDLQNILSTCTLKPFNKGLSIFKEGDPSFGMFILLNGAVEISASKSGVLNTVGAGEIFGEMGAIGAIKRTASATTTEDSLLLHINHMQFTKILETYPKVGHKVMTNICKVLVKRITELTSRQ